jgi:hypothetical protein
VDQSKKGVDRGIFTVDHHLKRLKQDPNLSSSGMDSLAIDDSLRLKSKPAKSTQGQPQRPKVVSVQDKLKLLTSQQSQERMSMPNSSRVQS